MKFSDMTQSEINAMSKEEFKEVSPFEKKSCYDCGHLKIALSMWCTNEEAKKARGTSLPGCIKCVFWKPDWKVIDNKHKTKENGYVDLELNLELEMNQVASTTSIKWYKRIFKFSI